MPKNNSKYLISVIIPIYNVGEYLEESILSIVRQDIGFEKNIELILVNDGSTDNSSEICKKYNAKYKNVIFVDKKNGGVSSARNAGIKVATSEFIAFFDGDDLLAKNFYSLLVEELGKDDSLSFAVGRTKKFDAETGYHATDGKFHKTQIIDLNTQPYHTQTLQCPILFRRSTVGDKKFNEEMTNSEDSDFMLRILGSSDKKYVAVREALYLYRRRNDESSATGGAKYRKSYYMSLPVLVNNVLGQDSDRQVSIPQYVQFYLMYQLGWRMRISSKPDALTAEEWDVYKKSLREIVARLDYSVVAHGGVSIRSKERKVLFALKGSYVQVSKQGVMHLEHHERQKVEGELTLCISSIIPGRSIKIVSSTQGYSASTLGVDINLSIDDKKLDHTTDSHTVSFLDESIELMSGVVFNIPKNAEGRIKATITSDGIQREIPIVISSKVGLRKNFVKYKRLDDGCLIVYDIRKVYVYNGIGIKVAYRVFSIIAKKSIRFSQHHVRRVINKIKKSITK